MSRFWRLTPLVALIIAVALLIAGVALAFYSEQAFRSQKIQDLEIQAQILASSVTAALTFDDGQAAQEYVDALRANPEVIQAGVYDMRGPLLASYSRNGDPLPATVRVAPDASFRDDLIVVTAPVVEGNATLGAVYLRTAIEPLSNRVLRYAAVALLAFMASLVLAVLAGAQRALTRANAELQRQAEDLILANRLLQQQSRERERAEEALRQSQKLEAIGQLSGGVAHDFNNLLAVVIGNLELLGKRIGADERTARLLDHAMQGARRGVALTQRMLAFGRRQDLRPEIVDIAHLVEGVKELIERSVGPMVRVETDFPPEPLCARVDANQLELALINLAVNARDAMPDGGEIRIAAQAAPPPEDAGLPPGDYLCLAVNDTGTGMDEATLARAAEPFFTTKGAGKGTGLGLSMVHGLAAQSGGRLILESRLGEGTRAEIWLPLAAGAPATARPAETPPPEPASPPAQLSVLAVDDDLLVLMGTVAMLEDLGHAPIEAHSGEQALAIIDRGVAVDLVITDQAMPGMTGTQLAEAVAARRPGLPVLIATGYAELPQELNLPRIGKPFDQRMLAQGIADCMAGRPRPPRPG